MSPEKEKAPQEIAPNLFYTSEEGANQMPSVLFGIECGDGWFHILEDALKQLSDIAFKEGNDFRIDQIKEKYGYLRIYLNYETDEMSEIIQEAEAKSQETCEQCGNPGILRSRNHWCYTSCEEHVWS